MICTIDFKEVVRKPKYPLPEHAEQFAVQKDSNFTVRDIMNRYAGGITENRVFNGNPDMPVDPGSINPAFHDKILDAPNLMSVNRVDINDYEDFREDLPEVFSAKTSVAAATYGSISPKASEEPIEPSSGE